MRRALRAVVTLAAAGALGVAGAGAAQASAYGASPIAPFSYTTSTGIKSVPYGCALIHSITGEGVNITAQTATVDCAGWAAMRDKLFCDARVVFTFTNTAGRKSAPTEVDKLSGCRTLGIRLTNPTMPVDVTPGRACVTLYVNGEDVARATSCHVISS
ncbi:hypothetical protein FHN55_05995 [Streptomyces sp. NP160]|uniref:hypothetical protein n=1 Tax=Streptomyces sp. NP160 TaxID=2586637 RepID=UPI0011190D78|nr:hypothetical protein [Streptomyces sp. NP160]TNM68759.1 hypothetical protein FHN55_05995 [Streptomyces sp. NP160]